MQVGIDLVTVDDVREALAAHGERYLNRVYSEREIERCRLGSGEPDPVALAAAFAAKEAAVKALHVDADAVSWPDIELETSANGAPAVRLRGQAANLARSAGVSSLSVSLTQGRARAMAIVVSTG